MSNELPQQLLRLSRGAKEEWGCLCSVSDRTPGKAPRPSESWFPRLKSRGDKTFLRRRCGSIERGRAWKVLAGCSAHTRSSCRTMSFGCNSPHIPGALTLHPRASHPAFWELSMGQLRGQVMAVVAEWTWVLGETLPPQVCSGSGPQLPTECSRCQIPGTWERGGL